MRGMITKERNATYNMGGQAKKKKKKQIFAKGQIVNSKRKFDKTITYSFKERS